VCPDDGNELREVLTSYSTDESQLSGRVVAGRYIVEALLGVGGAGLVVRAQHAFLNRTVALKLLLPELHSHGEHRDRFLREAQVASQVQHENVVQITDFGITTDKLHYLVMEYLEGSDLRQLLKRRGPLDATVAARFAQQLCSALEAIHTAGFVHRDLKPANCWIADPDGVQHLKLLDFGIASLTERSADAASITGAGTTLGTPHYMAPEQILGEDVTPATDIYALGCTLFECVTGRPVFGDLPVDAAFEAHLETEPPKPSSVAADVPTWFDSAIMLCLRKEPRRRPRTAAAASRMFGARPEPRPDPLPPARPSDDPDISGPALETGRWSEETAAFWTQPKRGEALTRLDQPTPKPARRAGWIIALAVVLAAAAGVAWWSQTRPDPAMPNTAPAPAPTTTTMPAVTWHASTVWRRGRLIGVGTVTAADARRRAASYRVEGTTITRVNGAGRLVENEGGIAVWEQAEPGRVIERDAMRRTKRVHVLTEDGTRLALVDRNGRPIGAPVQELLTYDANGFIASRRTVSAGTDSPRMGVLGSWGQRFVRNSAGLTTEVAELGPDGEDGTDETGLARATFTHNDRLELVRLQRFDRDGAPIPDSDGCEARTWAYDAAGNTISAACLHTETTETRTTYDSAGRVTSAATLDGAGKPVAGALWYARSEVAHSGGATDKRFFDAEGAPTLAQSGAHRVVTRFNEIGYPVEVTWFGVDDRPTLNRQWVARRTIRYDDRGNETEWALFGVDDQPCLGRDGYARVSRRFDDRDQLLEERYHGKRGEPVSAAEGFARATYAYDAAGNRTDVRWFGVDGRPVRGFRRQVAHVQRRFDDAGNVMQERTFGPDGKPATDRDGVAGYNAVWNRDGTMASQSWIGADGAPTVSRARYATRKQAYNARGALIEIRLFDVAGRPTEGAQRAARETRKVDARGRIVERRYFDTRDRPAPNAVRVARVTETYNRRGDVVERATFDKDGAPVIEAGRRAARTITTSDRRGQTLSVELFGVDGKPTASGFLWARSTSTYDARGNELTRSHFGLDGKPVLLRSGHSGWHATYDDRGLQLSRTLLGTDGSPVEDRDGASRWVTEYDARGFMTSKTWYRLSGEIGGGPVGMGRQTQAYDARGRITELATFGADGQPLEVGRGLAFGQFAGKPAPGVARREYEYETGSTRRTVRKYANDGSLIEEMLTDPTYVNVIKGIHRFRGLLISEVRVDSIAHKAGLQPGDVLLKYAGTAVNQQFALNRAVETHEATTARILFARRDAETEVEAPSGDLGVRLAR